MATPLSPFAKCIQCQLRERESANGLCEVCSGGYLDAIRNKFIFGYDPGKSGDPPAFCVIERVMDPERKSSRRRPTLHLRGLHEWPLSYEAPNFCPSCAKQGKPNVEHRTGVPYPEQVRDVCDFLRMPWALRQSQLLVDQGGVGEAVMDLFHEQQVDGRPVRPVGITFGAGQRPTGEGYDWTVPKRDLVISMQVQLQNGRLFFSDDLDDKLVAKLVKQMLAFKVKIDPVTIHDAYEAAKQSDHDDMVAAVAVACWWARRVKDNTPSQLPALPR